MNVPEKLINFRVYNNGADLVGSADVTLPKLNAMTQTVKGAGIAGEIDSPVLGHYSSTKWKSISGPSTRILLPWLHQRDIIWTSAVRSRSMIPLPANMW